MTESPDKTLALLEWILCRIWQCLRLIIRYILDAEESEYLEERFSEVAERHGSVMRISLFQQYVTVESAHLRDGEDADASERLCRYRKHLALSDV